MSPPNRRQTFGLGLGAGLATGIAGPAHAAIRAPVQEPTFTLLLVNDVYRMAEHEGRGGFPRLTAVVRAERARGVPMLYAHAGDSLSPSLMSGFDRGAHIVELLNIAPPDIFVPGNHEFDFGPAVFVQRMGEANFPVFAANLRDAGGQRLHGLRDSTLVTLGGVKVGLLGLTLSTTAEKSSPGDLVFEPELQAIAREAPALRAAGADLVVCVAHTGRALDEAILATGLVDILLSGHDHDLVVRYDGQRAMVESSFDARFVTALDVFATVTGQGKTRQVAWRPSFRIHDTSTVPPDPEAAAVVARLESRLSRELDVPVGVTEGELDSRIATVRARESSFGNLVADALRSSHKAEIAITNGGGIRGDKLYPAGTVLTRRDILSELPFGNTTVLVSLTGAQIRSLLETGFGEVGRPAGRFPQVSGLAVTVDATRPPGRRISAISVAGGALDESRSYTVASNSFLFDGGNGYSALSEGRTLVSPSDGRLLANEVMAFIREKAPLGVEAQGRIVIR
ncbi:bifunctional UDP-sugar hydrolase/5'-nucleotidase [Methylobacterium sp. Leaf466]|uniref:bifunctional metallophosphatase/5'-nucleotidase n=1 Tax=Methylobacterium sp. Leaf466 TaxID=1736386 RepID=UPI0006F5E6B4|nr:bifunctional UDP-sugar hydrolase/5'-nucleotidase [Methylobacterium sp. Leaf466]KQT88727.1 multifunctional 2',3'-cyclic-nucleotide 2'-phosphodiesterase/5'-nucleotidase/3'-nucleotidase [Methylobacterium sp. Leaf466]